MTPNTGMSPIRLALAVLFDHPELLTLDPARARTIQELIVNQQQDPHFADVWQYISTHPLGGNDPWAVPVPITLAGGEPVTDRDGDTLYQWALSPGMCAVIQQPLAAALRLVRGTNAASEAMAVPQSAAASAAGPGWTLTGLASRHGLAIPSLSFDADTNTCTIQLQNTSPRHLAVYVEFLADGLPVAPANWASRLPTAAQAFLESATVKYLGVLPPGAPVAGMAVPTAATSLSFTLCDPALGARLLFGGPGLGNQQLLVDAAAVLLTAVLDYAVPAILDGAAAGLSKAAWFNGVLADETILAEVLAATQFLFTSAPPPDSVALLQSVSANLGALLLGDALPTLQASITQNVGAAAIANAAPVLGWAETELAAQAGQPLQAQVSSAVLSSPATFSLDLVPVACTLLPDPQHGVWPDLAATYQIAVVYDGINLLTVSGATPQAGNAPVAVTFPALPAGGQVAFTAAVQSASGWVCGRAQAPAAFIPTADQAPSATTLTLSEVRVPLGTSTQYQHRCKLIYDPTTQTHRWQNGPAPTAVGLVPAAGAAFRALIDLTLQELSGDVGYTWQEGDTAAQYAFQNIGVLAPEVRLKFSGDVFSVQPYLVYDLAGSAAAAAAGTGRNYYLDPGTYPIDGRYHLRGVVLDDQTPFDLNQAVSWGAFYGPPSSLRVHPAGLVVACYQGQDTVQVLALPGAAVPLSRAPAATFILGPGSGIGAVSGPVATAVTSSGLILVLEQGNARVQACDAYGNPVPYFGGSSPVLKLKPETGPVQYLDLAIGPGAPLFVLSYQGSAPQAEDYRLDLYQADGTFLSRTTGVAAAHLAVDGWGRVYTLNYEAFAGPGGRIEPAISRWFPADS